MQDKKTNEQISKNVAARVEKISPGKKALTQELADNREEIIAFLDSLPVKIRARTLSVSLAQLAATHIEDKQEAKEAVELFRSKPFLYHMAKIINADGIEGALDEMANVDLDDPGAMLTLFTGETFTDEEIADLIGDEDLE